MPTLKHGLFTVENPLERVTETADRLGIKLTERLLIVRISEQTLQLYRGGTLVRAYVISTSARPPCNVKDSLGTPKGFHQIAERIGGGQPPGMVFKARVPTGHHFRELSEQENEANLITTRILWLRGLEPGVNAGGNVDSYGRYIYIHGTNHEDRIGTPASGGCVQMRNFDMLELYEEVRAGDCVWIE
jgi:hypothetical protein